MATSATVSLIAEGSFYKSKTECKGASGSLSAVYLKLQALGEFLPQDFSLHCSFPFYCGYNNVFCSMPFKCYVQSQSHGNGSLLSYPKLFQAVPSM